MELTETAESAKATSLRNTKRVQTTCPSHLLKKEEHLRKRIRKVLGTPIDKLDELYKAMDEIYTFVGAFAVCRAGCSACCHISVTISKTEVMYIEQKTGHLAHPPIPKQNFFGKPCPFLKEDKCSIYAHRPFVCRRHVSMAKTATWCAIERCNEITLTQPRFSEVDKSYEDIVALPVPQLVDIRQVF